MMMVVQRMFSGTDSFHLMAVPLFMYVGTIMEKGGISQRLIDLANALAGWLPGGLAAVTIVSAMFFAGISGSAAADAAAVGAVLIPAMKKSGYEPDFAAAVQAAGGSLGVIIPPSIPMIIFWFSHRSLHWTALCSRHLSWTFNRYFPYCSQLHHFLEKGLCTGKPLFPHPCLENILPGLACPGSPCHYPWRYYRLAYLRQLNQLPWQWFILFLYPWLFTKKYRSGIFTTSW